MPQTTNLLLYLKFDEVSGPAQDLATGLRQYSLVNTMARVAGNPGTAVEAQAAGDKCQAPYLLEYDKDPVSLACFVYFNSLPSANLKGAHPITIVARGDGTTDGYFLGILSGDTVVFRIIDTAGTPYEASYVVQPGDIGQWIHFMGVLVTNTSVKLYKNNVEVGTAVVGGFVKFTTMAPMVIGANFDGRVDEVKVWGKSLSLADRAEGADEIDFPVHLPLYASELPYASEPQLSWGQVQRADRDRYLGITNAGTLIYSRTGEMWENGGEVVGGVVQYLFWNEEIHRWFAFGSGGVARISIDGITWTNAVATVAWTTPRNACVYHDVFLLAADSGLYRSVDGGQTWVLVGGLNFAGSAVRGIRWSNSLWVVVGDDGKVSTSPDSVTWTPRANPSGTALLTGIARSIDTGRLVVVGEAGFAMTSDDDGLTWSTVATGLSTDALFILFYNHRFLVVSATELVSSDDHGLTWNNEAFPVSGVPVALSHSAFGSWLLLTATELAISGTGSFWEVELLSSVVGGQSLVTGAVQPGYWMVSQEGVFSILTVDNNHFAILQDPLPYLDSPYGFVRVPRSPNPQLITADLNCNAQELTAEILLGPTDVLNVIRYWELEIVPSVAYLRVMEEGPIVPERVDDTQIVLTFPTNNGIDLNVKRLRYVVEGSGDLQDLMKWSSPWIVVSCEGTVIPLILAFTSTTYSTFCVDITPHVLGRWYRIEWGEVGDGFTESTQGQLLDPACVSHGFPEGAQVQVRAFQSFNGGATYEPLTESNHLTFVVPPSTVVPLVLSLASFDYLAFQANLAPFAAGGWYRIEWGPASNPFIYALEGQYFGLPITVVHGMPIGTEIQIRALQSFDDGATWDPLSLSNTVDLEIPSGGGEALHLEVPTCYEDTFDAFLVPFLSGGYYRFEFGEVGDGFTNIADGIIFSQPANVFHGYPVGTLLQVRAYQSFDGGLTYDPDTMSNTVEIEVTALPNPVPSPLVGGAKIINIYEPQFTLPYVIKPLPGPLPSGFITDLFWRRAPEPGDPLAPAIKDSNLPQLTLNQLYSGRHRYRITMQMSNGYTYAQTYLLLTRAGVKPGEV